MFFLFSHVDRLKQHILTAHQDEKMETDIYESEEFYDSEYDKSDYDDADEGAIEVASDYDEQQSTELLSCDFCEKSFAQAAQLKGYIDFTSTEKKAVNSDGIRIRYSRNQS